MSMTFGHPRLHSVPAINATTSNDGAMEPSVDDALKPSVDSAVDSPPRLTKGRSMSDETRMKISQSRKGARHSEETKLKISQSKRISMSEETKRKIAESRKGIPHSEETKLKISQAMKNRPPRSIVHRLRISQARQRVIQSEETRQKISIAVIATKRALKRQRLAARAAEAAEEATADLRPAFNSIFSSSTSSTTGYSADSGGMYSGSEGESDYEEGSYDQGQPVTLDPLELERAVIEVTALRRQLTAWMDAYEKKFGRKPDLTEASETHPLVYGRFVRYVALRELVRTSSLLAGQTPVSWT